VCDCVHTHTHTHTHPQMVAAASAAAQQALRDTPGHNHLDVHACASVKPRRSQSNNPPKALSRVSTIIAVSRLVHVWLVAVDCMFAVFVVLCCGFAQRIACSQCLCNSWCEQLQRRDREVDCGGKPCLQVCSHICPVLQPLSSLFLVSCYCLLLPGLTVQSCCNRRPSWHF